MTRRNTEGLIFCLKIHVHRDKHLQTDEKRKRAVGEEPRKRILLSKQSSYEFVRVYARANDWGQYFVAKKVIRPMVRLLTMMNNTLPCQWRL